MCSCGWVAGFVVGFWVCEWVAGFMVCMGLCWVRKWFDGYGLLELVDVVYWNCGFRLLELLKSICWNFGLLKLVCWNCWNWLDVSSGFAGSTSPTIGSLGCDCGGRGGLYLDRPMVCVACDC